MKVLPVTSLKGGVGKSTVAAGVAQALHRLGLSIGALDMDFHAPNLPIVLGCSSKPSRGRGDIVIPPQVNGIKVLSWAMLWPENTAVTVEDVQINADDLLPIINVLETGVCVNGQESVTLPRETFETALSVLRRLTEHPGGAIEHVSSLLQPGVIEWGDLDWLIIDTPPESTGIVQVVAESEGVSGVLIVSHASTVSRADVRRTVDLFRKTSTPIYGLVINQTGEHDLSEQDMREFANEMEIPVATVIPHTRDRDSYFDRLAEFVLTAQPVVLQRKEVEEDPFALATANKFLKFLEAFKK